MARSLRGLGFLLLVAAVWLALAGATGWAAEESARSIARMAGLAGVALLGAGIVLGAVGKLSRPVTQGRCVRCGKRIERGQTYCMDHLIATVTEAREQGRGSAPVSRTPTRTR